MKHPFRYYFQKNIWLTTSGHFSTPDLVNAITAVEQIASCFPLTIR